MSPLDPAATTRAIAVSPQQAKYAEAVDRESGSELLVARTARAEADAAAAKAADGARATATVQSRHTGARRGPREWTAMKLSAPKQLTFLIAILAIIVGIALWVTGTTTEVAFWAAAAGGVLFAAGNVLKGL